MGCPFCGNFSFQGKANEERNSELDVPFVGNSYFREKQLRNGILKSMLFGGNVSRQGTASVQHNSKFDVPFSVNFRFRERQMCSRILNSILLSWYIGASDTRECTAEF